MTTNEDWVEFGMSIVGDGSDEEKWPPGTELLTACKNEFERLKDVEINLIQGKLLEIFHLADVIFGDKQKQWFDTPIASLGRKKPNDMLDKLDDIIKVKGLLLRIKDGAF